MAIHFYPEKGLFKLSTRNTDYIFIAASNHRVYHLYYGKSISDTDEILSQLALFQPASISPMPADSDLPYSPDWIMQEFSGFNTGDFRSGSVQVKTPCGAVAADVYYHSHQIVQGKKVLPGLPSSFAGHDEEEIEALELTLKDPAMDLYYTVVYSVFPEHDVIVRSVKVLNRTQETLYLERAMSAQLDLEGHNFDLITLNGSWARERSPERCRLRKGLQGIRSVRGSSGHCNSPALALAEPDAGEKQGLVYGFMLAYSGNHECMAEVDQYGNTRVLLGIHPDFFEWKLKAGDSFQTPEVFMTCSGTGFSGMSRNFHDFLRNHLIRQTWALKKRPILINNWEATYFDFDDKKILSIAETA